ncbi:hypothetical protein AWB71_00919 [Caballeronia peredens]|nr:hypothetical protein AWB71_00919 [Caballeronia peredens]
MKSSKQAQSRKAAMVDLIKAEPGITSAEIATRLGLQSSKPVPSALWQDLRSGRILTERVVVNSRHVSAYYLPEQVDAETVERIRQSVVDAKNVVPIAKTATARSSVFDVAKPPARRSTGRRGKGTARHHSKPIVSAGNARDTNVAPQDFACAVASDGRLMLIRGGKIELALSDVEAATLQQYLVKRAAASLIASFN